MNKTSTLNYRIHNLFSLSGHDLIDVKSLVDVKLDYPEVHEYLEKQEYDVRQEIVDSILRKVL